MDIKIGETPPIGPASDRGVTSHGSVEARILAIREPRRRSVGPPADRPDKRNESRPRDPANGRVLLLLVPDRDVLPEGLEKGDYRVFLRFARR